MKNFQKYMGLHSMKKIMLTVLFCFFNLNLSCSTSNRTIYVESLGKEVPMRELTLKELEEVKESDERCCNFFSRIWDGACLTIILGMSFAIMMTDSDPRGLVITLLPFAGWIFVKKTTRAEHQKGLQDIDKYLKYQKDGVFLKCQNNPNARKLCNSLFHQVLLHLMKEPSEYDLSNVPLSVSNKIDRMCKPKYAMQIKDQLGMGYVCPDHTAIAMPKI